MSRESTGTRSASRVAEVAVPGAGGGAGDPTGAGGGPRAPLPPCCTSTVSTTTTGVATERLPRQSHPPPNSAPARASAPNIRPSRRGSLCHAGRGSCGGRTTRTPGCVPAGSTGAGGGAHRMGGGCCGAGSGSPVPAGRMGGLGGAGPATSPRRGGKPRNARAWSRRDQSLIASRACGRLNTVGLVPLHPEGGGSVPSPFR